MIIAHLLIDNGAEGCTYGHTQHGLEKYKLIIEQQVGLFDALFCNSLVNFLGTYTQFPTGWVIKESSEVNYGGHVPQLPVGSLAACLLSAFNFVKNHG